MTSPKYCINCGVKLEEFDRNSNGDNNCVCAKCRAEENHDFDAFPGVAFDRQGNRVKKQDRYYVDERGGCIAVVDRLARNPEDNGLHPESSGIVKYWQGFQQKHLCPTCHQVTHTEWMVADETKAEAKYYCEKLNLGAICA